MTLKSAIDVVLPTQVWTILRLRGKRQQKQHCNHGIVSGIKKTPKTTAKNQKQTRFHHYLFIFLHKYVKESSLQKIAQSTTNKINKQKIHFRPLSYLQVGNSLYLILHSRH